MREDYVEVALRLFEEVGEVRLTDIAARLGVSHPTVSKALRRLEADGLVALRPYRAVQLTDAGRQLAEDCRRRHSTVVEFLRAIGLDAETAEADAEGIEHHVSPQTLSALLAFMRRGVRDAGG